ncbi:MAG TPA: DUF4013 domain-containing protein [Methanobacterium sp.]|nr:DUF4013 domain-containing protein [Methanobacterium sp.]
METIKIFKDALTYPLSDWKKILFLGIIIILAGIEDISLSFGINNPYLTSLLIVIGFIIGFLINGYMFRILKSSLNGDEKLPEFNKWIDMGVDGAKVFLAFAVYLIIPVLIIVSVLPLLMSDSLYLPYNFSILGSIGLNLFVSVIFPAIMTIFAILFTFFAPYGIFAPIYLIIAIPLFLVAIANMAYYDGEFKSAFRFREILEEISSIGWSNLLKWYLMLLIFVIVFIIISSVVSYISSLFNLYFVYITVGILLSLVLTSYFYIFLARSLALFYMPDKEE